MRKCVLLLLVAITGVQLSGCQAASNSDNRANTRNTSSNSRSTEELVDLNSASKSQLINLPGIGEAYAQKIIDNRPYREKTDLIRRNIIPEAAYQQISERVIARQR